jgi:hypothetical protein
MDYNLMIERLGFPAVVLIALSVVLWRILVWVGHKVVIPVTESHIALVNETKKNNEINTEANKVNAEANAKIGDACMLQAEALKSFADKLEKR